MDAAAAANGKLTPERVFREQGPRVYNLARRMLGNDADAEDVAQDVLLQVVRKLDTFRGDSNLSTWLHRVTVNAALAHRAKRARREQREQHESLDLFLNDGRHSQPVRPWSINPADQAEQHETTRLIEQAIADLPEMYRDVYVLADVESLANAEIGELLTLSLPAVKSRLHRARLLMRRALAKHFEEAAA